MNRFTISSFRVRSNQPECYQPWSAVYKHYLGITIALVLSVVIPLSDPSIQHYIMERFITSVYIFYVIAW